MRPKSSFRITTVGTTFVMSNVGLLNARTAPRSSCDSLMRTRTSLSTRNLSELISKLQIAESVWPRRHCGPPGSPKRLNCGPGLSAAQSAGVFVGSTRHLISSSGMCFGDGSVDWSMKVGLPTITILPLTCDAILAEIGRQLFLRRILHDPRIFLSRKCGMTMLTTSADTLPFVDGVHASTS